MLKRIIVASSFLLTAWLGLAQAPAMAHVKWFLHEAQAKLLSQPKPELFTQLGWCNSGVIFLGVLAMIIAFRLSKRWTDSLLDRNLQSIGSRSQSSLSLLLGVLTGVSLIKCFFDMNYFVPNMHLHPCCSWIAQAEALIGLGLVFGFMARACGAAMLFILFWGLIKFSLADCADLIPMYGLATYFLLVGRGPISLDEKLHIARRCPETLVATATMILRTLTGIGLIGLGFDEKLLHPQLAMDLLNQHPSLNFVQAIGVGNDLFVLCGGVFEVSLGLMLVFGIFPRLAITLLAFIFTATTVLFGSTEFFGHMPYYGITLIVLARPRSLVSLSQYKMQLQAILKPIADHWKHWGQVTPNGTDLVNS